MINYPVKIDRDKYLGMEPRRKRKADQYNEMATSLENHINSKYEQSEEETICFHYRELARICDCPVDMVRDALFGLDGGDNGIMVTKPIYYTFRAELANIWADGRIGAIHGEPRSANPYIGDADRAGEWDKGWNEGHFT